MIDIIEDIRERHQEWERIGFIKAGPAAAINAHADRATLLRALDAERARRVEVEGWQPIETAPKNMKVLVSYRNRLGKWRTVLAFQGRPVLHMDVDPYEGCEEVGDEWICPLGWWEDLESYDDLPLQQVDGTPTHWRPLPAPPATLTKETP